MYKKLCLAAIAVVLVWGGAVSATTYYVSPSGNDNNSGTSPSDAWQTIDKVNTVTFSAGDSILFEGGQMFSGSLYFDEAGTSTNPITVGSYGTGRATVSSGSSDGLHVYEAGGYEVKDLIFVGSGPLDPDGGSGVKFKSDKSSGSRFDYVRIDNVDISQYHWKGIAFAASNGVGYIDVEVTNSDLHDNGDYGMTTWGDWPPGSTKAHADFYVANCTFYDNKGIPGRQPHSGNGIEMDDIDGSLVEFCEAWNNGELCNASGGGPFGIWQWQVDNAVIQFCESHHNKTSGGDGGGFDLDGGCRNNIIQYCYSHDNYGTGYGVFQIRKAQTHTNNEIRYNISENDSLYNKHGAVYFWAAGGKASVNNAYVYNNTLYKPAKGATILAWTNNFSNINLYNNIIMSTVDKPVVQLEHASAFDFLGNCYWADGNNLEIKWGNQTYTSLPAWRSATGEETLNGNDVGLEADPCLMGGSGDTAFRLKDVS
ncbi:MAG: right-handed parallel beta-helix repeat-containing protein, partial [Planctomycetota bacterium]